MLDYISNRNIEKTILDKDLAKIIKSKSNVCPKFLADCYSTEEGIGYCTLDENSEEIPCEKVQSCILCKAWWCEPTNENYIKAKRFLEESKIAPLKQDLAKEEAFFVQLLSDAKTVNIDGIIDIDQEYKSQLRQASLKLKASADKLISFQQSLLNYNKIGVLENGKEESGS